MGLLKNRGKGRGLKANLPFFFLPSPEAEEGGDAGAAVPRRWPWGAAAAMEEGKMGRGPRGIDPPPRLGRRRREVAAPRRRAAAGRSTCGGGNVGPGRGRWVAVVVVVFEGVAGAVFIGEER